MMIVPLVLFILSGCQKNPGDRSDELFINSAEITGQCPVPPGPAWLHNAVFYQIYPQTFYDSNGDGIGDLPGIITKLDYVKSLGVDGFWLNPFFESPFNDGGYDVSDYYKVAPRYGTNQDAKRLFDEAETRDLKVLFDYVVSYTSLEHPWFQASARQEPNKYSNWYIWTNNTWLNPPDAYRDVFIKGYSRRNGQFMRNFYWNQPALNFGFINPTEDWMLPIDHPDVLELQKELQKVLRFWMDMGADGFRADMAGALVKNSHVTADDPNYAVRDAGSQKFWKQIRQIIDKDYPQAFMVAEWSYPESALDGGGFHADFFHWFQGYNDLLQKERWRILNGYSDGYSFFDKEGRGDITNFLQSYLEQYRKTVGKGYINLPLGNHDIARLNIQRSDKDLEIIFAFSLTMPGIPFIYYGNEIGMRQLYDLPNVEGAYPPRAGARTPMQWSKAKNMGFSTADPQQLYLPVDPAQDAPNVASQDADSNSVLNHVRNLIRLRKTNKALSAYAEFVPVYAKKDNYPFIYARANAGETVLVILNPANRPAEAQFNLKPAFSNCILLAGSESKLVLENYNGRVKTPARSYSIYKLEK